MYKNGTLVAKVSAGGDIWNWITFLNQFTTTPYNGDFFSPTAQNLYIPFYYLETSNLIKISFPSGVKIYVAAGVYDGPGTLNLLEAGSSVELGYDYNLVSPVSYYVLNSKFISFN